MRKNPVKALLKEGKPVVGCLVAIPAPIVVEVCALLGFDYVVIDTEHGIADLETVENMVRAADAFGTTPLIRVAENAQQNILRYMDTGALGVQMPQITTAAEAKAVVNAVKYRPMGLRGLAGVRAAHYGMDGTYADYINQTNAETLIIVHIETPEALANVAEMAQVPGVDVIFIGPTDLSYSLGHPGHPEHPEVQKAFDTIITTVRQAGKWVGILARDAQEAEQYIRRGVQYICTGDRALMVVGGKKYVDGFRAVAGR